jgi:SagB-type dehydrogenase family enzyme
MIAHRGVVNALVQTNKHFQICPQDRVLALTALHHDMSVFDLFGMLAAGGTLVVPQAVGRRDPAHWSELMKKHQVTVWNSVPPMMEMLLEYAGGRKGVVPDSLRVAFLGGDWIQVSLPHRLKALGSNAKVVSVGGPTETTLWNIWYPVEQVDAGWKSIPYGKPIANTKYYILNELLETCPTWVPGEMCCSGVGVAKGYWRDEEKTRAKFVVHPVTGERIYRTGDLGRYLPDGNIEFIGRVDFQVKIQGQRIELGEIESVLQQHPAIKAAVVSAVGETQGKKRLVAYVVPKEPGASLNGELRTFLASKLPEYMVPSAFVKLKELPLTANGKVNRLGLPAPEEASGETAKGATEASGLLGRVGRLVGQVLKVAQIDPKVNLISYGANSIDMVRMGNAFEKEFGFRPRMDQLFRLQTVEALTQYYQEHLKEKDPSAEAASQESNSGLDGDLKALVSSYRVLLDPVERDAFKASQPGIRRGDEDKASIALKKPVLDADWLKPYRERRSYRQFSLKPIPFESFSLFLSCLLQVRLDEKPKYRYASPGGLYPGQIYLHVKPGRIEGIDAGTYYYHPVEHKLVVLTPNVDIDRSIHIPFINTPIFDEAAFSVFYVVQLAAIAPHYGEKCVHFATLEAGVLANHLEVSALPHGIGLCQIGGMDFEKIRHLFKLDQSHLFLHSLLGGLIPASAEEDKLYSNQADKQSDAAKAAKILGRIKELSKEEIKKLLEANKQLGQKPKGNI